MAKKRKGGKKSRTAAISDTSWTTLAGGIIGNVVGQVISDGLTSYLDGGGKKKSHRSGFGN
jgi:hypothetical protein